MTKNRESSDSSSRWEAFVRSGKFDNLPHPADGYKIEDIVGGRDGITYLVKGLKPSDEVILGLDRKPNGRERTATIDFIRPIDEVAHAAFKAGSVSLANADIETTSAPLKYEGKNANLN